MLKIKVPKRSTNELAEGGTTLLRSADEDFNIPDSLTVTNAEVRASILQ